MSACRSRILLLSAGIFGNAFTANFQPPPAPFTMWRATAIPWVREYHRPAFHFRARAVFCARLSDFTEYSKQDAADLLSDTVKATSLAGRWARHDHAVYFPQQAGLYWIPVLAYGLVGGDTIFIQGDRLTSDEAPSRIEPGHP